MAWKPHASHIMVQMLVRLSASRDRVDDIVNALRAVMRTAQQARGCSFANVYRSASDRQRVAYVEDWDDAADLRQQFGTARFCRLMELLEMASERPVVEFRVITEMHGLEYIPSESPHAELHRV